MTLTVFRCSSCGDTFPLEEGSEKTCPSCGSLELAEAAEPLL